MKWSALIPSPPLRPWVNRYWSWQEEANMPPLLPGTGGELFFWYQQPVGITSAIAPESACSRSALLLPRDCPFNFHSTAPFSFIAVRFRAGALRHFCLCPEAELIDTALHPREIWGDEIRHLEQKMAEAGGLRERIQHIEGFLLTQLQRHYRQQHHWLDEVIRQVYYRHSTVTQSELVTCSGFSTRYFQKIFRQHFGVTPRHFQRIIRFEQLTRHLLLNRQQHYLASALEYGYYDQSHFIHDFRYFTGNAPSRFFQENNFSAHFYNHPTLW